MNISIFLKTVGGMLNLVSAWLLLTFIPVPVPVTYINHALVFAVSSSVFIGFGLLISAFYED